LTWEYVQDGVENGVKASCTYLKMVTRAYWQKRTFGLLHQPFGLLFLQKCLRSTIITLMSSRVSLAAESSTSSLHAAIGRRKGNCCNPGLLVFSLKSLSEHPIVVKLPSHRPLTFMTLGTPPKEIFLALGGGLAFSFHASPSPKSSGGLMAPCFSSVQNDLTMSTAS